MSRDNKGQEENLNTRVPPGQHLIVDFPVLDLGVQPTVNLADWSLTLGGLVETPQTLTWLDFQALPQHEITVDIHCVTRWSKFDVQWKGVMAADLIHLAQPKPTAQFVVLHSADGYTTNLPLAVVLDSDVLLAHTLEGKPLTKEHGGPVRLVVPKRYFWKSAKWITAIVFHEVDHPGFWEVRGYHNDADPFKEERYTDAL